VRLCDALFFFTSPRPTGSTLPSRLCSTSLWSAFRLSLKVCWLHLIPVWSAVLQATTAPCLHFKPLDLLSRVLMFAFVRAEENFLFGSPCTLHDLDDAMTSLRFFVSAGTPTRRSGACETWVPMGPQRTGSQPSPTGGPDLLKTRRPVRGPYPT
jgi:hypothetical protein